MRQSSPYPVRPGKKDCQFYLKNGLCRYRSSCRFNHPTQRPQVRTSLCLVESKFPFFSLGLLVSNILTGASGEDL